MGIPPPVSRFGSWFIARLSETSTYAGFGLMAVVHGNAIPQPVLDALNFWGPFIAAGLIAATTKPQEPK